MTYEDFEKFVQKQCMYETIYDDSDGRRILVIRLLDAYGMVNKAAAAEREWQELTDEEIKDHWITCMWKIEGTALPIPEFARAIEAKLKEKNA